MAGSASFGFQRDKRNYYEGAHLFTIHCQYISLANNKQTQFPIALFILVTTLPCWGGSFVLPENSTAVVANIQSPAHSIFRRDDEWELVTYGQSANNGKRGGTGKKITRNGDMCTWAKDTVCVDIKVDVSIASVFFSWKRESNCHGNQTLSNVVQGGHEETGINVPDGTQGVRITGDDGGRFRKYRQEE